MKRARRRPGTSVYHSVHSVDQLTRPKSKNCTTRKKHARTTSSFGIRLSDNFVTHASRQSHYSITRTKCRHSRQYETHQRYSAVMTHPHWPLTKVAFSLNSMGPTPTATPTRTSSPTSARGFLRTKVGVPRRVQLATSRTRTTILADLSDTRAFPRENVR